MTEDTSIKEQVYEIISNQFDCAHDILNESTTANEIVGWDSLSHTELLLNIESELAITFDLHDLMSMSNVGDMINIIESKI